MKATYKNTDGTSFHNVTIKTSVNDLILILGEPQFSPNTGEDKVNFEWDCETNYGNVFTIYDWKEYRILDRDEVIEFHIGAHSKAIAEQALEELLNTMVSVAIQS